MPLSAIEKNAADLIVPLDDIGQVIGEMVAGTPRPKARSELEAVRRTFGERGEVAALAREIDWSRTPLGAVIAWPEELRLIIRTTLDSPFSNAVWWGEDSIQLFNDAWRELLGMTRQPTALGGPARETWAGIWHIVGPIVEQIMASGEPASGENYPMLIDRHGYLEEVYVTFSYTPVRNSNGTVVGLHNMAWETTGYVIAERRMRMLATLSAQVVGAGAPRDACERAAAALSSDPADVPFALFYLFDKNRQRATLAAVAGLEAGSSVAPHLVGVVDDGTGWPLSRVLAAKAGAAGIEVTLDDLAVRFPGLSAPAFSAAGTGRPQSALLLPLSAANDRPPVGVLILALSPHRPFDDGYRSFVDLAVQQVNAGIAEARAKQIERERSAQLTELDRAKTEFFSNVSHEFRTPLALMLAPLEDLLRERDRLPPNTGSAIDVAVRNARRLLRLVDSLLDFSEVESQQRHPSLERTNIGDLTADIVSAFRSAIEAAGLQLRVEIERDLPMVPLNREMWEKIVSNLLSNAFKFTFEGVITIKLRALRLHAELEVSDSGVGIPQNELPNIFKRFHRVRGAKARTVEGSGIGLAIAQDLVQRMGGQIRVRSAENRGSTFTIWMPLKSSMPIEPNVARVEETGSAFATGLATEARRWLSDAADEVPADILEDVFDPRGSLKNPQSTEVARARLLIADDNADMREYLRRLLGEHLDVHLAADGVEALESARRLRPDVIIADVMMPRIDGFELLRQVRGDSKLKHVSFILLTARAGEQAAIEGLLAGADDYIAKPFSPRELVVRITAGIERARVAEALRRSERQDYILKLSDALRPLNDALAVQDATMRILGEHLQADRVIYADVSLDGDSAQIRGNYVRGDIPQWTGNFSLAHFGESGERMKRGETVVIPDLHAIIGMAQTERAAYTDLGACASITVPRIKNGRLSAVFAIHYGKSHQWTNDELFLVQETAERAWTAVERVRAETELQTRNDELERFNSVTVGREMRMIELKNQVNALRKRLGEPPAYAPAAGEENDHA